MKKILALLLLTGLLLTAYGCAIPTKKDLLTAHTWKVGQSVTGGIVDVKDYSKYRITFYKNGTYNTIEADGDKTNGTWRFNEDMTKIIVTNSQNGITLEFNIIQLTRTELKINFNIVVYFEWTLVPA